MKSLTTLTSVVLITFLLTGCSPQREKVSNLDERLESYEDNGTPIMVESKPFTGILFQEYSNGQIEYELSLKKGIPNGFLKNYYENGQLGEKLTFKDGKRNGLWEFYYENGQLEVKRTYKDGKKDGLEEFYYENGQLESKGTYKDGEMDGPWVFYFESGSYFGCGSLRKSYSGLYRNGEKISEVNGVIEEYYSDGNLRCIGTYINGKLDGPFEKYYENGQLESKGTYKDGERDGPWENYDEEGQMDHKLIYRDGEIYISELYTFGLLFMRNYEETGLNEFYYDTGQLSSRGKQNENFERDGRWEIFNEDGTLNTERSGLYEDGVKVSD
jgi:antitoxin component YwqK of YwqJK toxin-antitoxin module